MANIYQLTREYNDLYELALANADEETGELDERITDALDIKGAELETKGISVACVVKRLNSTADEIDREIERLTKMKKAIQSTTERLKDGLKAERLQHHLERLNKEQSITKQICPKNTSAKS